MMRQQRWTILVLAMAMLATGAAVASATCDRSYDDLKKGFESRFRTLLSLKQSGKVGETWEGLVDLVQAGAASERVDSRTTVRQLVDTENEARKCFFEKLAADQRTSTSVVAREFAKRKFDTAGPEEYLKGSDGKWVQKKDVKR